MMRRSSFLLQVCELPPCSHVPQKYSGPAAAEVAALRAKYQHPMHKHLYKDALLLNEAKMQYVWDDQGKRYLDMFGGVCTIAVGHNHPRVVEAQKKQIDLIQHTTALYNNPAPYQLMEALAAKLPQSEEWVFHFTNSGSECTDFAMLAARCHTGNHHVITMRNGYHGMTDGARNTVGLAGWKHPVAPSAGFIRAIPPIAYRGLFGTDKKQDLQKYVDDLEVCLRAETPAVAAFLADRIQGLGGIYPLMEGYIPAAYAVTRKYGGVCIADEVQSAAGRLGDTYWGFEQDAGVVPDIITMAKNVGNGVPIGVVALKRHIAESIQNIAFFNTFGGNPVSTAVALENLRVIDDENVMQRAKDHGAHILAGLAKLQDKYEIIGDVRGKGYMIGIEFVADRATKAPVAVQTMAAILEFHREHGILIGKGGTFGNVVRLQGPMCSTTADADYFLHVLEQSLKAVTM